MKRCITSDKTLSGVRSRCTTTRSQSASSCSTTANTERGCAPPRLAGWDGWCSGSDGWDCFEWTDTPLHAPLRSNRPLTRTPLHATIPLATPPSTRLFVTHTFGMNSQQAPGGNEQGYGSAYGEKQYPQVRAGPVASLGGGTASLEGLFSRLDRAIVLYSRSHGAAQGKPAGSRRHPWRWIIGALVLIAVILGAVLGGVFGSRAANDKKKSDAASGADNKGASGSGVANAATRTKGSGGFAIVPTVSCPAFPNDGKRRRLTLGVARDRPRTSLATPCTLRRRAQLTSLHRPSSRTRPSRARPTARPASRSPRPRRRTRCSSQPRTSGTASLSSSRKTRT